jgi:serine/threonine protein kinase
MYKQDKFVGRTLLKKYNIIRKLGEGSFGCIYKAVHKSKFYALKIEKNRETDSLLSIEASIMQTLTGGNNQLS